MNRFRELLMSFQKSERWILNDQRFVFLVSTESLFAVIGTVGSSRGKYYGAQFDE
jgi:hypothetical protein